MSTSSDFKLHIPGENFEIFNKQELEILDEVSELYKTKPNGYVNKAKELMGKIK